MRITISTGTRTLIVGVLLLLGARASAQDISIENLTQLSLTELMDVRVQVPAALTKLADTEAPASVTVITAEDIRHTPARNIYDLIEVYVPGAIWMDYEEGPQLGISGSIANRNFRYLLRVNGRLMNNKGHYGASSELEQWELSDIQRIEIIRGPGSVIYGPGAVAGVINVFTHDANSAEGTQIAAKYFGQYDAKTLKISHGYRGNSFSIYGYGSVSSTVGDNARHFVGGNNQSAGFIGEDFLVGSRPLDYFSDYRGDPQLKFHVGIDFLEHWKFWSRYTQQGSAWRGNETQTAFEGGFRNQQGLRARQWTNTLQYENQLRDNIRLSAMLSADSFDVERSKDGLAHPDVDHPLNKKIDFSETEVFFRSVLNWQASEKIEIAFGGEYAWDKFGPGWGESKRDMRIGPDGNVVSGPTSNALLPGNSGSADSDGVIFLQEAVGKRTRIPYFLNQISRFSLG